MDHAAMSRAAGRHAAALARAAVLRADSTAAVGLADLSRDELRRARAARVARRAARAGAALPAAAVADRRRQRFAGFVADLAVGDVGLADRAVSGNHRDDDLDLFVHSRVFGAVVRLLLLARTATHAHRSARRRASDSAGSLLIKPKRRQWHLASSSLAMKSCRAGVSTSICRRSSSCCARAGYRSAGRSTLA